MYKKDNKREYEELMWMCIHNWNCLLFSAVAFTTKCEHLYNIIWGSNCDIDKDWYLLECYITSAGEYLMKLYMNTEHPHSGPSCSRRIDCLTLKM